MAESKFREILRIAQTDIKGNIPVGQSLTRVKGVSYAFSNALCNVLNLDKTKKAGELTDADIKNIEDVIIHPAKYKVPPWLYNRQKDSETGYDQHLINVDLKLRKEFDIRNMKKIKSYKGMRHALGLPVRGQRTRAHFRHGASLGVQKKAAKMARKERK